MELASLCFCIGFLSGCMLMICEGHSLWYSYSFSLNGRPT